MVKIIDMDFYNIIFRNAGIHIVNPQFLKIGSDDPLCFLRSWQIIIVAFGLFVRSEFGSTGLRDLLVQRNAF